MNGFWSNLPKPFFALAPLEDVTDAAFRRLIAKYSKYGGVEVVNKEGKFTHPHATLVGGPDVMFTEFTSADGLLFAEGNGRKKLLKKLLYSESERPIVAQLFSAVPERMEAAARIAAELGFDGIDINMGCPDRAVERGGCGAALIKNPALARELIRAAKRGVHDVRFRKPNIPISVPYRLTKSIEPAVSIKTRIGYDKDELDTWLPELLAEEPAAVTLHARTRKEMSNVPARWNTVLRAVKIRDALHSKTLIVGNGDVKDLDDARAKAEENECDGIMLGRAIFGNPSLFSNSYELDNRKEAKVKTLVEHLTLFDELLSDAVSFSVMKRHFASYISGWVGAKQLRMKLMSAESVHEAHTLLREVLA